MIRFLAPLFALVACAAFVSAEDDKPVVVKADRDWVGLGKDANAAKDVPKNGLVTDEKVFAKVWKALRADEKLPEIDFKKKFVYVTLSLGGPNRPRVSATLKDGDLNVLAVSTLIGGDGFGYSVAEFDRKGVKTVMKTKLD